MGKKHLCDHHCVYGYENEKDQRKCLIAVKKKWDEIAPSIYELYRKWLDEEDGFDDEVEITIKLPSYIARSLDLKRIEKLYFELYNTPHNKKDCEAMQAALEREKFIELLLYRYSMDEEDERAEEHSEYITKEKIEASSRECNRVLEFHSRISKNSIDHQDALFLKYADDDAEDAT